MIGIFRAALVIALFWAMPAQANAVFPTLSFEDLNGDMHVLPKGLPGDPTIVFIAYKRNQQPAVNTWINALGLDPNRGAEFVELPVVGANAKFMKSFIDNGMRSGIVDPALRARTITIYENASVVNRPLGFAGRDEIRVLIVSQNGDVLWSTSGSATEAAVKDLQAAFIAAQ
ncbi:hypothetical protein WG622_05925 [Cognatishimia sp. D5M38]|uniref:Transcriptional regulator n=1 Tax=Cognatishimia coralii TaxID=3083254 RepID=A0ABU8QED3_9RHOB